MAADYFLKIDGIPGESFDDKHKDEIEVMSWSWGATQSGTMGFGGGGGGGKVSMQDFHFAMRYNKASPQLLLSCASGKHIAKAVFIARKAGEEQQEYLKISFSDILVASYTSNGADSGGGDAIPIESISLNFSKIEIEYKPQDAKGKLGAAITTGWDVKKNVKV
jgi:type VI secretion system secreted protein Hcp